MTTWFKSLPPPAMNDSADSTSSSSSSSEVERTVVCFLLPPAGGSPHNSFRDAARHLPAFVEPVVVNYSGRGARSGEAFATDAEELVPALAEAMWAEAAGRPFAVMGHSMGGHLAYLVAAHMALTSFNAATPLQAIRGGVGADGGLEHLSQLGMLGGLLTKEVVILRRPQQLRQLLVCPAPAPLLLVGNLRWFARSSGPWAIGSRVALHVHEAFGHWHPHLHRISALRRQHIAAIYSTQERRTL